MLDSAERKCKNSFTQYTRTTAIFLAKNTHQTAGKYSPGQAALTSQINHDAATAAIVQYPRLSRVGEQIARKFRSYGKIMGKNCYQFSWLAGDMTFFGKNPAVVARVAPTTAKSQVPRRRCGAHSRETLLYPSNPIRVWQTRNAMSSSTT